MKSITKLFLALVLSLTSVSFAHATLPPLLNDMWSNFTSTIFKSGTGAFFYSNRNDEWHAGVTSPLYRPFLQADGEQHIGKVPVPLYLEYGGILPIEGSATLARGSLALGGSLHFQDIKQVKALAKMVLPQIDWGFATNLAVGYALTYSLSRDESKTERTNYTDGIEAMPYVGVEVKFGGPTAPPVSVP